MAIQCARCGAQNPDGNLYCQTCGTPLGGATQPGAPSVPAPPQVAGFSGPPPTIAPPSFAYHGGYYAPGGGVAPPQRTPWMVIIAVVVAVIVLLAGLGTAYALLANRGGNAAGGATVGDLPSPTPAVSQSPIASPTSTPGSEGTTESNSGLSVVVPIGWSVTSKDNESIVVQDPNGDGSVTIASGPSVPAQSAQDNKTTVDAYFKSKYPDVRDCPNTSSRTTTLNGAAGVSWTLCFTLTSGSSAIPAAASIFAGANQSGDVYYAVLVLTRQDNFQSYLNMVKPVLQGVVWKLS